MFWVGCLEFRCVVETFLFWPTTFMPWLRNALHAASVFHAFLSTVFRSTFAFVISFLRSFLFESPFAIRYGRITLMKSIHKYIIYIYMYINPKCVRKRVGAAFCFLPPSSPYSNAFFSPSFLNFQKSAKMLILLYLPSSILQVITPSKHQLHLE